MTAKKKTAALLTIFYTLIIGPLIGYFGGTLYYNALARQPISAAVLKPGTVWASLLAHRLIG